MFTISVIGKSEPKDPIGSVDLDLTGSVHPKDGKTKGDKKDTSLRARDSGISSGGDPGASPCRRVSETL